MNSTLFQKSNVAVRWTPPGCKTAIATSTLTVAHALNGVWSVLCSDVIGWVPVSQLQVEGEVAK